MQRKYNGLKYKIIIKRSGIKEETINSVNKGNLIGKLAKLLSENEKTKKILGIKIEPIYKPP